MTNTWNPNDVVSRIEAARRLKVDPDTVREWSERGKLGYFKVGVKYFYRAKDIESLISWTPPRK